MKLTHTYSAVCLLLLAILPSSLCETNQFWIKKLGDGWNYQFSNGVGDFVEKDARTAVQMQMVVWDFICLTADEQESIAYLQTLQFDVYSNGEEDLILNVSVNDGEQWLRPVTLNVERDKWVRVRVLLDDLEVKNVIKSIKFQKVDSLPSTVYIANVELNNETPEDSSSETSGCVSRTYAVASVLCVTLFLFAFL